jgi:hypothetical protein
MILGTFNKQPAEVMDYDIDFTKWMVEGDSIVAALATVDNPGLTITQTLITTPVVKVWVSGGTTSNTYKITVIATSTGGRVKEVEFKLKVKEV